MNMKFIKGVMVGGLVSAGLVMMCTENNCKINKNKMIKKGKQWAKKMGVL